MSFQWSYSYIKNLVYVEFDITNMTPQDTLYDCAMGIYMDSDVGEQTASASTRANNDKSSYVTGSEFAYTYDADRYEEWGYVGSRVCTPDPELLEFACWTWAVGNGPDDSHPRDAASSSDKTSNQKYWLLTGKNPKEASYTSLREHPNAQVDGTGIDTRYLFAFYGDQKGDPTDNDNPTDKTWNLAPGKTMKIVIAVFPGKTLEDLKNTAASAKEIYRNPQTLTTVVLPDTCEHYYPYKPPAIPGMYAELDNTGNNINLWWDNRAEFTVDEMNVKDDQVGWQDIDPSKTASYMAGISHSDPNYNVNALVNPIIANRLRHDFQSYSIWGCSASGEPEAWSLVSTWDKIDTDQDLEDYDCAITYHNYGGVDLGNETGLPNQVTVDADHSDYLQYYRINDLYDLVPITLGDVVYGKPLYDPDRKLTRQSYVDSLVADLTNTSKNRKYNSAYTKFQNEQMLFANPDLLALPNGKTIYLALVQDSLITVSEHMGQSYIGNQYTWKDRLARRYYTSTADNPPKGLEYYVSVTAKDRGIPDSNSPVEPLETGKDGNMLIMFPGPTGQSNMDNIYVVPNPYVGMSKFDGYRENDTKGDRGKRLWFVNLPERCTIRIFTLAGDLVDTIDHNGAYNEDIISLSNASVAQGLAPSGMHSWDLLARHGANKQVVVSGVYLYSVEDKASGDYKVGKFVIIR
jgi:hypothetical protein